MGKNSISIKGDCNYTLTLCCLSPWTEIVFDVDPSSILCIIHLTENSFWKGRKLSGSAGSGSWSEQLSRRAAAAPVSWEPPWAVTQPWELTLLLCYFNSFVFCGLLLSCMHFMNIFNFAIC